MDSSELWGRAQVPSELWGLLFVTLFVVPHNRFELLKFGNSDTLWTCEITCFRSSVYVGTDGL